MAGKTYNSPSGGKVWVKSTSQSLSDKDWSKESNRVGKQLTVVMKKTLPPRGGK